LQQPLSLLYRAILGLPIQPDHFLLFELEPCRQKFIAEEVRLHRRSSEGCEGFSLRFACRSQGKGILK
jgi:hypothetical protein